MISVAEYFLSTHKLKINDKNQPLFLCKAHGKDNYFPTEFCTIDGVPESIRSDPRKMRDVLQTCRKNPEEKLYEIREFCKQLFQQKVLGEWGIEIKSAPVEMDTKVLSTPELQMANGKLQTCDMNTLRRLPI